MKRPLRVILSWIKWNLFIPLARIVGLFRSTRQIISTWPQGEIKLGPKLVLFMHYDGRGMVRPQLLNYIREFRDNGRDVVFVSNAGKFKPEALKSLQEICACVILRRNIGYDFGAWRDALDFLGLPKSDTQEIIFANDSVFGPLKPLSDVLQRFDYGNADIWGLTESWQGRYHLQSFFLAFGPVAIRAKAFGKFWQSVRPVPVKAHIVKEYEIGVTQEMMKGGLTCAAIWTYDALIRMVNQSELAKLATMEKSKFGRKDPLHMTRKLHVMRLRDGMARRMALNPTSDLWRQLLLSGFPFIKRELLRSNPTRVEDVGDWVAVVREEVGADPEPILQDLRAMLKGIAP